MIHINEEYSLKEIPRDVLKKLQQLPKELF